MKVNVNLWMKPFRARQLYQLKEPGLKRKINADDVFPSKIKRRNLDDDCIRYVLFFPEVKNRAMSPLLYAC